MGKEGFTVTIHHRSGAPVSRLSFGEGDELVVGRAGAVDIALDDPSIARRHAVITGGRSRFSLELQGGSPALVNGQPVQRAELAPPVRVILGDFALDVSSGRAARPAFDVDRASSEEKIAWAGAACQHLASVFRASAVPRRDDSGDIERWEVQLTARGRPVRMSVDGHFLTPTTEARLDNRRGFFVLIHDPEAVPKTAQAGDAWADQEPDDRTFVAPHLYTKTEYCVAAWNSLDERAKYDLVTFIQQHRLGGLVVEPSLVKILSHHPLSSSPRIEATAGEMVRFVVQVAELFERGEGWLGFTAGNPQAGGASYGQPPAYRGPPVDCDYCNSSCLLNERSMCPNCGAPLRV